MNLLLRLRTTRIRSRADPGIIWLEPARVHLFCGSKWPHYNVTESFWKRRLLELDPGFSFTSMGGDWDLQAKPITQVSKYIRINDFVNTIDHYEDSIWFRRLVEARTRNGVAKHKDICMHSMAEIHAFFRQYAIPLTKSLAEEGYTYKDGEEVGSVAVDRDGRIHKAGSGNHRFFLARILGVSPVPVQVTFVHPEWLRKERLTLDPRDRHHLLDAVRRIAADLAQ